MWAYDAILDHNWTPAGHCGILFISFSYLLSVFRVDLSANSVPFGADMTG
ncbi:hypothetical protein PMIN02_002663 [Paraphaeosphaeria minitans]